MSTVKEIKITGFDPDRLPKVRKENYIDLHFQLSEKPPEEWCDDFNILGRRMNPSPKIDKGTGLFISSYVQKMEQIPTHFSAIKKTLKDCSEAFLEKIRLREIALAATNSSLQQQGGEQQKLNQIIESLDFES